MIGWLGTRETVNLGLLFGDICLLFIIGRMLWREAKEPGWMNSIYNQAAAAIFTYFLGMTIVRFWGAVLLYYLRRGYDVFTLENTYPISLIGTGVSFLGTLFIIQTFSPDDSRNRYWKWVLLLTGIMTVTFTYLSF